MRPNLNASYPVHIPGVRLTIPMEVKIVENVVTFNGEKLGEIALPEQEPVVEEAVVEEAVVEEVVEEAPAASAPTWSSFMTKSELLAIASQLGLTEVTSSNTKAEILSALDATKQ